MASICELCERVGGELLWQGERCRVVYVEEPGYPGFCRVIWEAHVKEMTDLSRLAKRPMMGKRRRIGAVDA